MGSALHNYYSTGTLKSKGSSITEGIGQSRITENLKKAPIDISFDARDADALRIVFDLLEEEGLIMGGSTGINIIGAMKLAKKLGPGSTIVTILCDYGTRYFSKVYNKKFLKNEMPSKKVRNKIAGYLARLVRAKNSEKEVTN